MWLRTTTPVTQPRDNRSHLLVCKSEQRRGSACATLPHGKTGRKGWVSVTERQGDAAREQVSKARIEAGSRRNTSPWLPPNMLIDAVEEDLIEQANQRIVDNARLIAVETQSRIVAEAVVAITEAVCHTARQSSRCRTSC